MATQSSTTPETQEAQASDGEESTVEEETLTDEGEEIE